jgi:predicted Zn-dependent protease with MMP-like domain
MAPDDAQDWIDEVDDLILVGRPDQALERLRATPADDPWRWLLAVDAHLALDEAPEAARALERASELAGPDALEVRRARAALGLATWRLDDVRHALAGLGPDDHPALPILLALFADLDGDRDRSHAVLAQAHRRSPEDYPAPLRLSPDAFEAIVAEAARDLPAAFRARFDEIPVIIDPMPTAEVLGAPASGLPPDLYGLFAGAMAGEEVLPGELPPRIFLFQRNLERDACSLDELREEIRVTLYHELAHALGFEEDGVEELGLG